jgi:antitoxin FitA
MQTAVLYADCMKTLQIRNMPDDVHRRLKARAANEGRSLSEYALSELRRSLERPTWDEWWEIVRRDPPVELTGAEIVGAIHEARAERDRELDERLRDR